jgi:hypothetical protein
VAARVDVSRLRWITAVQCGATTSGSGGRSATAQHERPGER